MAKDEDKKPSTTEGVEKKAFEAQQQAAVNAAKLARKISRKEAKGNKKKK